MPDDKDLLEQLRQRSPEAFQQLFDLYSDRMFRLAASILSNQSEAEDIVQEAFLRFFEKLDSFEGRSKIGTWLYRTVHNASIDRIRRDKPVVELADLGPDPEEDAPLPEIFVDWSQAPKTVQEQEEIQKQLEAAVQTLPESLRTTFLLRDVEELSTAQVAEIQEISAGAVKVRLHRARLLLREQLAEYFAELMPQGDHDGM